VKLFFNNFLFQKKIITAGIINNQSTIKVSTRKPIAIKDKMTTFRFFIL